MWEGYPTAQIFSLSINGTRDQSQTHEACAASHLILTRRRGAPQAHILYLCGKATSRQRENRFVCILFTGGVLISLFHTSQCGELHCCLGNKMIKIRSQPSALASAERLYAGLVIRGTNRNRGVRNGHPRQQTVSERFSDLDSGHTRAAGRHVIHPPHPLPLLLQEAWPRLPTPTPPPSG